MTDRSKSGSRSWNVATSLAGLFMGLVGLAPLHADAAFLAADGVRECREYWESGADLTQYVTDAAVDDIDEVRAALGYERLDVIGVSYGSRAATVYMRRHPARVRTALLLGPAPTGIRMPFSFAADAQAALDGWLVECANDPACYEAFPDLRTELWDVVERLEAEPAHVTLDDPASGERRPRAGAEPSVSGLRP
jgi:pimeloyl-ACP methyl ester carboxylesterase